MAFPFSKRAQGRGKKQRREALKFSTNVKTEQK